MHIIWGIIWIAIGVLIMKYTFSIVQNFGHINFAEKYLGGGLGGTFGFYKILGVIIIFLALLYMFGGFGIITRPLVPLFGAK